METAEKLDRNVAEAARILGKVKVAKARYEDECAGRELVLLLSSAQQETVRETLRAHRGDAAIAPVAASARSIGGKLCASVAIPRVLPNGVFDFLIAASSEQLLFEDAVDIAIELATEGARQALDVEWALREAEERAKRQRLEIEAHQRKQKVQAARDARWSHLTPTAQAAFRLAAKHPSGTIGELARALIASETEPRKGEIELPEDLDALLWRLTADKLTDEQRALLGLS